MYIYIYVDSKGKELQAVGNVITGLLSTFVLIVYIYIHFHIERGNPCLFAHVACVAFVSMPRTNVPF